MTTEFLPGINLPVKPFQGTFGVAPAQGGSVSSVPPGQHAGNIDLRDLTEGSARSTCPVFQPSGKLFTGDSHAAQGDGEVNNQALESAMREVRVQVVLHKNAGWQWPFAETDSHWYVLGIDLDLNEAFRIATRNVIEFLHRKAGLSRLDAYSLASIAVSFRVTQFVDQTRGVHAMIPKAHLFGRAAQSDRDLFIKSSVPMNVIDVLRERGFVAQISDEPALRQAIDSGPITLYQGFDPSATSMHTGNLVGIMVAGALHARRPSADRCGRRRHGHDRRSDRTAPRSARCSRSSRSNATWPASARSSAAISTFPVAAP